MFSEVWGFRACVFPRAGELMIWAEGGVKREARRVCECGRYSGAVQRRWIGCAMRRLPIVGASAGGMATADGAACEHGEHGQ